MRIKVKKTLTPNEEDAVEKLQKDIFSDVSDEEASEDFYCQPVSHVLATEDKNIIGYTSLYRRQISYKNTKIHLGGAGGLFVIPKFRRHGLGKQISLVGLDYLKKISADIAFVSVDTNKTTNQFYKKIGFKKLPQKFSWTNAAGKTDSDHGGMITPVVSQDIFDLVLRGDEVFYVGEGYW